MGFDSLYRDCQFIIVAKGLLRFTTLSFLGVVFAVVFQKSPHEILVFSSEIHFRRKLIPHHVMSETQLFRVNIAVLPINTKDLMVQVIRLFLVYAVVSSSYKNTFEICLKILKTTCKLTEKSVHYT